MVKEKSATTNVYTINSNIHGTFENKKVSISSPDDLFKINMTLDQGALGDEWPCIGRRGGWE